MAEQYWYKNETEPRGPYTRAEIQEFKTRGIVTLRTPVSTDGVSYGDAETVLGVDFFAEPQTRGLGQQILSIVGLLGRVLAHGVMLGSLYLAYFKWDIPHSKPVIQGHGIDVNRVQALQVWCRIATPASVVILSAAIFMAVVSARSAAARERLLWPQSFLALAAFLVPVSCMVMYVLGLLLDFMLSLAGIH